MLSDHDLQCSRWETLSRHEWGNRLQEALVDPWPEEVSAYDSSDGSSNVDSPEAEEGMAYMAKGSKKGKKGKATYPLKEKIIMVASAGIDVRLREKSNLASFVAELESPPARGAQALA